MSAIQAILMGIIQGLTEFLPISSSGHLVFSSGLYKILCGQELILATGEEIFFDIMLHVATLVAVLIFFRKDLVKIIKEFSVAIKTRDFSAPESKLPLFLIVGTFFTVLVAFPFKEVTEKLVSTPFIVSCFLIFTGCVLFFTEKISDKIHKTDKIDMKKAIIIGLAQGLAAFPGISRSGMTICSGMLLGLDRVASARYSFLLSILIIMGASVFYPILEFKPTEMLAFNWGTIAIGFAASLIVGYFCIKYFLQFLNKHSMKGFAYYCWSVGVLTILLFHFFG